MDKILFLLAIGFVYLAISSHHRLHKAFDGEQAQGQSIDSSLKGDEQNPETLSYALTKMTNSQPAQKPSPAPMITPKSTPTALSREQLTAQVTYLVDAIQLSNEESPGAFEKALALTSKPEDLNLRLTVFQAALNMQFDSIFARNLAIRETISLLVVAGENPDNPNPEEVALRDVQRNIVTTAYKVYLQYAQDQDLTLNDTVQAIKFQTDPWVRRQIIFECTSRFPQLREKLNE